MIAKQDDDRVVIQSKVCETVQHLANLGVSLANGRMIGVNETQCLRLFKQALCRNSGVATQLLGVMKRMRRGSVRQLSRPDTPSNAARNKAAFSLIRTTP